MNLEHNRTTDIPLTHSPEPEPNPAPSPAQNSTTQNDPKPKKNPKSNPSNNPSARLPSRRRRSSIVPLPKAIRDQINQMLDDGLTYGAISKHLRQQGIKLSDDCIGRWKKGGYNDYLRELRLLNECRIRYELSLGLARQHPGIDVFQAAHKIAAAQIGDAVAETGADSLRAAIRLNPLNLVRALNSLSRLTAQGLQCERHLSEEAQRQACLKERHRPEPGGIRPETLARIERELKLL